LWLKELAIQTFGTKNKIALQVGMLAVLLTASVVLGLLSRKRLAPLQAGIVGFGILGAVSALDHVGTGVMSSVAPLCGVVAGLFAANRLHSHLAMQRRMSRMPQQSRVPLGWDRRRFIRTVGTLGALSGGGLLFSRSREQSELQQIQDLTNIPLPPLTSGNVAVIPQSDFHPTDPAFDARVTINSDSTGHQMSECLEQFSIKTTKVQNSILATNVGANAYYSLLLKHSVK
jgi:hypothetical protein